MRRRSAGREPVAYLLGRRGFRRLELVVDARVLVPRPETELLVEAALGLPRGARVVDVGTGSGAVALALKDERGDLDVRGTDVSEEALAVARANAARLGLDVALSHADLLEDAGPVDAVLSNPPYVAEADRATLPPEVARHEPALALFAGPDGLDVVRRLVAQAGASAATLLALEVGQGQAPAVAGLVRAAGFSEVEALRDLAGIERVVVGAVDSAPLLDRGDRRPPARGLAMTVSAADAETFSRCISVGGVAVFPTDTVYGLACEPDSREAVAQLYFLKRRRPEKPAAVMFFSLELALAALPELGPRTAGALRTLLPGGVTLLLPNPRHRWPLACGPDPDTLGLRVPDWPPPLEALAAVRWPVLQSSANDAGGQDARSLDEVPAPRARGGRPGARRRRAARHAVHRRRPPRLRGRRRLVGRARGRGGHRGRAAGAGVRPYRAARGSRWLRGSRAVALHARARQR